MVGPAWSSLNSGRPVLAAHLAADSETLDRLLGEYIMVNYSDNSGVG